MKLMTIVCSPTGGTKKAAQILAAQWDCERVDIDLLATAREATAAAANGCITPEDICIIAAPVFGGRIPAVATNALSRLKGNGALAVLVAVYGNRAYEDALLELRDTATNAGFVCVAGIAAVAEHSILRRFAEGRPDVQDNAQLAVFAEQIKAALSAASQVGKAAVLAVPGNHPYKEYKVIPTVPKAGRACTACGACAQECPAAAISPQAPRRADSAACISCMRCIAVCPKQARRVSPLLLKAAEAKLAKACAGRKENELFLAR